MKLPGFEGEYERVEHGLNCYCYGKDKEYLLFRKIPEQTELDKHLDVLSLSGWPRDLFKQGFSYALAQAQKVLRTTYYSGEGYGAGIEAVVGRLERIVGIKE